MSSLLIRFANDILIKVGMSGFIDYLMPFRVGISVGPNQEHQSREGLIKNRSPFLRA